MSSSLALPAQSRPADKNQMQDYATHKGLDLETCERWLAPNRGY